MATTQPKQTPDATQQVYKQFSGTLSRQAEQLGKLDQSVRQLQDEQQRLKETASQLLEPLERSLTGGVGTRGLSPSGMLACVRRMAAATCAGEVLALLGDEATRMDVRAVVFDVRGRAAWAFSASGFSPEVPAEGLRTLVVPLNHDGPFRRAFEMRSAVETSAAGLERSPNLLARLTPAADALILLVPVNSAGCVAALLYAEIGGEGDSARADSLKVLAEFAGAQIDRLMVLNGGLTGVEAVPADEESVKGSEQAAGDEAEPAEAAYVAPPEVPPEAAAPEAPAPVPEATAVPATEAEAVQSSEEQPLSETPGEGAQPAGESEASEQAAGDEAGAAEAAYVVPPEVPPEAAAPEAPEPVPEANGVPATEAAAVQSSEEQPLSAAPGETAQSAEEPQATAAPAVETALPTVEEEKIHRDARRFSKLLVSEIELYNKNSVTEGRRNKDLYQRLKKDIDRSRETYEKRFAHTAAHQFDYFHEELVRALAENDPALLGSGYPGPSV